jgi:2-polyprenyl-6-methoxyphenol hydroxylase-like FAD-dependent oxidoreductase
MSERVVVIGAGMAGLCSALALSSPRREIVLLEKDPPPPAGDADQAFFDWDRRGVGQLRHSHAFLARLRHIIKQRHPALLDQLRAAGCREIGLLDVLPAGLRDAYRPLAEDADLAVLTSRRTTLELVMRRYVEALPGVAVLADVVVRNLIIQAEDGDRRRVCGVQGDHGGQRRSWLGDLTIDAAGRNSQTSEQLVHAGVAVAEETEDCGILYYTRHYRLNPEAVEPRRGRGSTTGDLSFIKYGLFPGDNRCFSITLAAPEIETALRQAIVDPTVFDRVCSLLPGIAAWTDAATAQPISKVFGMGDLKSRWRSFVTPDQQAVLGFFAVGDSLIRTNPLYGRGCSFAAVEAEILRGVLDDLSDPAARARLYDARVKSELSPYFDAMRTQDRAAVRRARNAQNPTYAAPLRERVTTSFFNDGARIAMRSDIDLLRAALRDFHMIDPPGAWMRRPANAAKIMRWWTRGRRRNADLYPPPLGPSRDEMMRLLGLPVAA